MTYTRGCCVGARVLQTEVLNQLANLWPVGTMKVQRLKKVYSDHLVNQGGNRGTSPPALLPFDPDPPC